MKTTLKLIVLSLTIFAAGCAAQIQQVELKGALQRNVEKSCATVFVNKSPNAFLKGDPQLQGAKCVTTDNRMICKCHWTVYGRYHYEVGMSADLKGTSYEQ